MVRQQNTFEQKVPGNPSGQTISPRLKIACSLQPSPSTALSRAATALNMCGNWPSRSITASVKPLVDTCCLETPARTMP